MVENTLTDTSVVAHCTSYLRATPLPLLCQYERWEDNHAHLLSLKQSKLSILLCIPLFCVTKLPHSVKVITTGIHWLNYQLCTQLNDISFTLEQIWILFPLPLSLYLCLYVQELQLILQKTKICRFWSLLHWFFNSTDPAKTKHICRKTMTADNQWPTWIFL